MALRTVLMELKKGLIFDGATGSMLIEAGLTGGRASESWVLERPDEIESVHTAYARAGADVIGTCTFGGNRLKLESAKLADKIEAINRKAVRLARVAAGSERFVAGNIGPTGQLMTPNGPLTENLAQETYAEQAGVLAQNGVDFLLAQTFYDRKEMVAAIKGVRSVTHLPVFATMTFEKTKHGFSTIMGDGVEESMSAMLEAGAAVVGANCTLDSEKMLILAREIRILVDAPLLFQANAGAPELINGKVHYPEDAETFAENMSRMKSLGVEAVGGCCGTTPKHIRSLIEKFRQG
jgi:5-methyltetrahydrofolate--homocysteine methyltransferase